jgi:serine/threonine protein phosphatase PrpC
MQCALHASYHLSKTLACYPQGTEDVSNCSKQILGPSAGPSCLFSVLDGHCGRKAADEVAQALPRELGQRLIKQHDSMAAGRGAGSAWLEAFQAVDAGIKAEEGCTATGLLVWLNSSGQLCLQVAPMPKHACCILFA